MDIKKLFEIHWQNSGYHVFIDIKAENATNKRLYYVGVFPSGLSGGKEVIRITKRSYTTCKGARNAYRNMWIINKIREEENHCTSCHCELGEDNNFEGQCNTCGRGQ
jgi:hypothetical protein